MDLFRPFTLGVDLPHFYLTTTDMYRNYFTTAFRNFRRQWGFSFINIIGLALGMATFMIILTYVSFEQSYDDYHTHKKQVFRWNPIPYKSSGELWMKSASAMPAMSSFIKDNMPEVKEVARLYPIKYENPYLTVSHVDEENNRMGFNEEYAYFTDEAFLTMFDIQMMAGDTTALHRPNTVILSASTAIRYFGSSQENIIGQMLNIPYNPSRLESQYMVTGIFQDLPPNTHFQMDMMMSYNTLSEHDPESFENAWLPMSVYTYLQLHPQVSEAQFRQKRSQYVQLLNERHQLGKKHTLEVWFDYNLLRVDAIHLQSDNPNEIRPPGNAQTVYYLLIIGLLVILIAWVNYVNLTTAKAVQRAKEVGVRKVAGASRGQLILQFLSEAFVLNLLSVLVALFTIWLSLPFFQQLTGKPLTFHLWYNGLPNMQLFFIVMALLFFTSTLLSGIYPALVLSSYKPLKILRGNLLHAPSRNISLRAGLVVFQFVVSVVLIAGTQVMYWQMEYMQNQHLGFDISQILVINPPTDDSLKAAALETFKDDLSRQTFVESVATSSTVPGRLVGWGGGIGSDYENQTSGTLVVSIDYNFLKTYNFKFIAGRNFSKAYGTDHEAVIINVTVAEMLGFEPAETALHQSVFLGETGKMEVIIGIVEDFHQSSLKEAYDVICFVLENPSHTGQNAGKSVSHLKSHKDRVFLSLKINTTDLSKNLKKVEEKWHTYFPGFPFKYTFLDEAFNQQYKADLQFGKIFGVFAGLAIFIAGLGIFGLSSYLAVQKSKEIGIRKVLGATVTNMVVLLSGKFVKLVMVASIIALPLAYFVFDRWLENYAFRIEIGWWFFVIPIFVVFLIAIVTISVQTIKAALANPVDSLKYE